MISEDITDTSHLEPPRRKSSINYSILPRALRIDNWLCIVTRLYPRWSATYALAERGAAALLPLICRSANNALC